MNKRTKLLTLIGVIAAVVSAVVLVIVFWDKLLEKCSCHRRMPWEDGDSAEYPMGEPDEDIIAYGADELEDYADLKQPEE